MSMGAGYGTCLSLTSISTIISLVALQWWTQWSIYDLKPHGSMIKAWHMIEQQHFSSSYPTGCLIGNFVLNVFALLLVCLKIVFFRELSSTEVRKLLERLINYVVYKGTFLPLIIPATIFQACIWTIWLSVLCSLKMFQALARDRLERLNSSPSTAPWTYFRVYSVLFFVLALDFFWIMLCFAIYSRTNGSSICLLLFFEPLSIGFETLQAVLVHGFQFLDIWLQQSIGGGTTCCHFRFFKYIDTSAAGSLWEWKSFLIRNLGFILDMGSLLMALGHYLYIWWLHGMSFQLMDVVLFLNIRALVSTMIQRVKGFIKLRKALGSLHAALPDATAEELRAYDDECAICREPMAKAKRLCCKHLFHLGCLRSWLDQGLSEVFSCPTCRKPLSVGRLENAQREIPTDEQLARELSLGVDDQNAPGDDTLPTGIVSRQAQNPFGDRVWRESRWDPSLASSWLTNRGMDSGASASTAANMRSSASSSGLVRVQTMMRNLAAVGEPYAQIEDSPWSLWPLNPTTEAAPAAAASGGSIAPPLGIRNRYHPTTRSGSLHIRSASRGVEHLANMLAMAETVREVLPHVPDELILQDLQRTNSVAVTVNNLLQMM